MFYRVCPVSVVCYVHALRGIWTRSRPVQKRGIFWSLADEEIELTDSTLRARVGEVRTTRALLLSEHLDVEALKFPNQRYGPIHSKACIPNSNWLSVCRAHPSQSTGAILLGIQNFTVSN